jgi:hypothetical protein
MKLQFSLATLLVCVTVLAIVAFFAGAVKVEEPGQVWDLRISATDAVKSFHRAYSRSPTANEIIARSAIWGTPAVIATLVLLWTIRRLKSRRENGPPVG